METLAEYLDRVMRQKNLTPTELAKRSQLDGHTINRFRRGVLTNPTVETILKLATGLGVNPHEVFAVASGIPPSEAQQIDLLVLFDFLQKLIGDPAGFHMLRQMVNLSPGQRQKLLGYLEYMKPQPAKGKPRRKK